MNETYRSYESYKSHLLSFHGKIMSHLVLTGAGGRGGQRGRLRLEPAHYLVDGAFELRVFAFNDRPRVVLDLDVRVDSVAFYHPFAFGADESEFGHENRAAVN